MASAPGIGRVEITKTEWLEFVDSVLAEHPAAHTYWPFQMFGICPTGIITPLSVELWNLHHALGKPDSPAGYYELPTVYADATKVIGSEMYRIDKGRSNSGDT